MWAAPPCAIYRLMPKLSRNTERLFVALMAGCNIIPPLLAGLFTGLGAAGLLFYYSQAINALYILFYCAKNLLALREGAPEQILDFIWWAVKKCLAFLLILWQLALLGFIFSFGPSSGWPMPQLLASLFNTLCAYILALYILTKHADISEDLY